MFYCYIIQSRKNGHLYAGSTGNLRKRLAEHNKGLSISTRRYMPWVLIYYEAFQSEIDARNREMMLKHHGKGIAELKKRLSHSLLIDTQKVRG